LLWGEDGRHGELGRSKNKKYFGVVKMGYGHGVRSPRGKKGGGGRCWGGVKKKEEGGHRSKINKALRKNRGIESHGDLGEKKSGALRKNGT